MSAPMANARITTRAMMILVQVQSKAGSEVIGSSLEGDILHHWEFMARKAAPSQAAKVYFCNRM